MAVIKLEVGSNSKILEKHRAKSKEEIEATIKKMEQAKEGLEKNAEALDRELDEFNTIEDPLINPVNKKALCWVRRPTQEEWESIVPAEILKYRDKPQDMPKKLITENKELTFKFMEALITKPKHTAAEWKKRSNLVFIKLFQLHIENVFRELGIIAENF